MSRSKLKRKGRADAPARAPAALAAQFTEALALHRAGRLSEAEQRYRAILALDAGHAEAHHHLGIVHYQRGEHIAAIRQIDAALKIDRNIAAAHNNRGAALAALRRLHDAVESYERAVALAPDYVDASFNRGNALAELGRLDAALASYDAVIARAPHHAAACAKRGNVLHRMQRFAEAVASFDRALVLAPDHAEACNNRGITLARLGRFEEAVASCDRAVALHPGDAEMLRNRASLLVELGRFEEAVASYDRALALRPDDATAFNDRAVALCKLRRFDAAIASCDRAIALEPDNPEAFSNRGNALAERGRLEEAVANYDQAIALRPDFAEALCNRGNALSRLRRTEDALGSYERAILANPGDADPFNNRGNALGELRRFKAALASYDRAIALRPDYAEAFSNRSNALRGLRRLEEALASCDRAIALAPNHAEYHNNRAITLFDLRRLDEALASYDQAIAIDPRYVEAYVNRGFALRDLRRFEDAAASFATALALKPGLDYLEGTCLHARMHVCEWTGFTPACAGLLRAVDEDKAAALPFQLLAIAATPEQQLRCARIYGADRDSGSGARLWRGERYAHGRIRVAYLSADLRDHPIAMLTAGMFARHDRTRFETVAISFKSDTHNDVRERLSASFDRFIDVQRMSDDDVARLVRELEIDIAVDLNGYTEGSRPYVFMQRPAPVQVNWLGYAGTLGQAAWDYILADRFVVPSGSETHYAENVVVLPDCFMATDADRKIADRTPSRAEAGLPQEGFIFCCFNNSFKVTPDVFDVWMRVLGRVAGSVLWLSATNAAAVANLRREAQARGIAPERLIFAPRVPLNEDHLARLRLADLFLDTGPYNAHTTAVDSLWTGVPVLTCPGRTFASRVAGSLLRAIGLPELIVGSLAEYETIAVALASDRDRLATVRAKLGRNREIFPLFDTDRFTRAIEAAYLTIWQRAERGEAPQAFAVPGH